MATTAYPINDPLAVKIWAKKLMVETLKETWIGKFVGKGRNAIIQHKDELQKSAGDRVRIGLRMQLTGAGTQGDATLEGNEEALVTYSDDVFIDQLRHAVRSDGMMSEQRVHFNCREEAMEGLRDWFAGTLDHWFFNQIAGNTGETDTRQTGNQATIAPTATHHIGANSHLLETSLSATTTDAFAFADIDRCVALAKTFVPKINPIRINGEDKFVMFIHPYQTLQLRKDASTAGNFMDISKAALQGGDIGNNPIYTGALGEYNSVILHESTRVPIISGTPNSGAAASFRRAIFCGAQAAAISFGQGYDRPEKVRWVEKAFDYENQLGVAGGIISGLKKMQFNSVDFATIVVSGYAPAAT